MRNTVTMKRVYLIAVVAALTLTGCGKTSDITKVIVKGNVTFDGESISNGEIRFHPTGGTRGPLSGGTIQKGVYVAEGRGGVPIGEHRVEILAFRAAKNQSNFGGEGGPVVQYLPEKYNSETTLVVTINKGEPKHDFSLTSQ